VTPEGVYDLGGNVSEWTADPVGSTYVLRGGNFGSWLGWTRAAHRTTAEAAATRTNIGFRCAR
ncbi:MAG: SUMF1/EgtB/PvdO family nonheme iron enzyme, partial [Kofleriaceae bacterium]